MKKPISVAFSTFVPVVLLALLKPEWLVAKTLVAASLVDVVFFRDVSLRLRDLTCETDAVPYRVRYPFFPILAGWLGYTAISFDGVSANAIPVVAVASAAAIAAAKFWISKGPLWPYPTEAAPF